MTFLAAEWRHLLMLNYEVPASSLEALVPRGTVLDLWQGRALVSVVGFRFLNTRLLGVPVPFHRNFDEVNLRFYVRRELRGSEVRRAVVFRGPNHRAGCASQSWFGGAVRHGALLGLHAPARRWHRRV